MLDINSFRAQQHLRAVVGGDRADAVVELGPGHRAACRRERRTRASRPPGRAPKPAIRNPRWRMWLSSQSRGPAAQLGHRARGEPVAAGLVPWELGGVDHQHVASCARRPRGAAAARHDDPLGLPRRSLLPCPVRLASLLRPESRSPVCWTNEDTSDCGGGGGLRGPCLRPGVRDSVARIEELIAAELGKADEMMRRCGPALISGWRQAIPATVHGVVGAARARTRRVAGHRRRCGDRAGPSGDAVSRRRHGRSADSPRRAQRQRPLGQQHRNPGRRLSVRDRVEAGVAAGPRRGARDRRDLRPTGHRADARDPRRRRAGRRGRALPAGRVREDGLPDRGVRAGSARRFPARTTSRSSDSAGWAASSARHSRSPTTSSTSTAIPKSRARCPAPTCARACTHCPVLYALRESGPDADRLRELLVGPVERRRCRRRR